MFHTRFSYYFTQKAQMAIKFSPDNPNTRNPNVWLVQTDPGTKYLDCYVTKTSQAVALISQFIFACS